jgi:hypothetical protein
LSVSIVGPEGSVDAAVGKRRPVHLDGVELCLRQLAAGSKPPVVLDLSRHPQLAHIGGQPVNLRQYDSLLASAGGR